MTVIDLYCDCSNININTIFRIEDMHLKYIESGRFISLSDEIKKSEVYLFKIASFNEDLSIYEIEITIRRVYE